MPIVAYVGDGTNTDFAVPFPFLSPTHIVVAEEEFVEHWKAAQT